MHRDSCGECPACLAGETSLCTQAAWVFGLIVDGGYATHIDAPERAFYRLPKSLPFDQGAILNCTYGTAFRGLNRFGGLGSGQRVLITGANGGVGSAAVQVAHRMGAEVLAVVRSSEHEDFVAGCGADHVIVDDGSGFHRKLPGGVRVDVALDCVGQPTFNSALRSVRIGGGLTVVGNVVQDKAQLNLGYLIVNAIHVVGSSGANPDDMARLLELHERAPLDIRFHDHVPLDRADEAQRAVLEGGLHGRIVLVM